ncbi:MAG: hypothetical protein SPE77_08150, partial [Collinsella sp.]|nr:hypothetical protein [Collinsella sp.]
QRAGVANLGRGSFSYPTVSERLEMIFLGRGFKNHCVPNDFLIPVPEKTPSRLGSKKSPVPN